MIIAASNMGQTRHWRGEVREPAVVWVAGLVFALTVMAMVMAMTRAGVAVFFLLLLKLRLEHGSPSAGAAGEQAR